MAQFTVRSAGGQGEAQISGNAVARRTALATRNLRDFDDLPTPVLSAWA